MPILLICLFVTDCSPDTNTRAAPRASALLASGMGPATERLHIAGQHVAGFPRRFRPWQRRVDGS